MAKVNKTGRDERADHFTKLIRKTMEEPAWRALSTTAQALYPWLKLEWRGHQSNNNGKIRLSVKQAAERIGVWPDAAARAFHDLQAKGFIVVTEMARLGSSGEASGPAYELTELATTHGGTEGRKLYRGWSEGNDFPVIKAKANNPKGVRRKQNPITKIVMVEPFPIMKIVMTHHENRDGRAGFSGRPHHENREILIYQGPGDRRASLRLRSSAPAAAHGSPRKRPNLFTLDEPCHG